MKKYLLLLTLLISTNLLFISCNNKGGGSGEAYHLKMRLATGDKFGQGMDMKMNIGVDMAGLNMDMIMTMDLVMDMEVLGDTAGMKKIKFTYTKSKMGMEVKGMPQETSGGANEAMEKAAREMEGKSIFILLDKKNNIHDVIGFDQLVSHPGDDSATQTAVKKMFSKEQLNNNMAQMFQLYPEKPVKVGETWIKEADMGFGPFKMRTKNKYKLMKVANGLAIISIEANLEGKGKMDQGGMEFEMDMDGTQEGEFAVNKDNGYLRSGNYKMDMTAKAKIMGQTVPYDIKATYTLKGH
ncbi:MAG TPA: DUF6263 family protein [Chitinophagaceae bacterium]|nr:DUF6263 family protein [Chitinophagaceae bacterium]